MSDLSAKIPGKTTICFARPEVELSASAPGEPPVIRGYAAIYDVDSEDLGGFRARFSRGMFDRVLPVADCRLLINHDPNLLMGRTRSGTLRLSADDKGLYFEGSLPDTPMAAHYLEAIRRGDMSGSSFSCDIDIDKWDWSGEMPIRTVGGISALYDVGPVTVPAFSQTSVTASYALESARREQAEQAERIEAAARRGRHARALFLMASLGL